MHPAPRVEVVLEDPAVFVEAEQVVLRRAELDQLRILRSHGSDLFNPLVESSADAQQGRDDRECTERDGEHRDEDGIEPCCHTLLGPHASSTVATALRTLGSHQCMTTTSR